MEKKEIKAWLVPKDEKLGQRKLGILKGKGKAEFKGDYKTTEEEFFGL